MSLPVFISHSLIVLSEEPDMIISASLDMATEETEDSVIV
jgi:hypothetical protein